MLRVSRAPLHPSGRPRYRLTARWREGPWLAARWSAPQPRCSAPLWLRLVDLNPGDRVGPALVLQELPLQGSCQEWYLAVPAPGRLYQVRLGCWDAGEGWRELARSAPLRGPAANAYRQPLFSVGPEPRQPRRLWLFVDAHLLLHGWSDPHRPLRLADQAVPVQLDGSFRLELPLRSGVTRLSRTCWIRRDTRQVRDDGAAW